MKRVSLYSPEAAKGWMPWGALMPIVCIVLAIVSELATALALRPIPSLRVKEGEPLGVLSFSVFLLVTFSVMGLVFYSWVRFVERRPLTTVGLVGPHRLRTFLGGLAIGWVTSAAVVAAIGLVGGFDVGGIGRAFGSPKALLGIAALLPCFALQSSVEEIIMRGWLLSGVARKLNLPLAVLLSATTFTLLHGGPKQHWTILLTCFFFSTFACAWAIRAGNIWGVMGWHAGWNWLLAVGYELPVTGLNAGLPALLVQLKPIGSALQTGGAKGPEGSLWCGAVLAAATVVVVLWRPRRPVADVTSDAEAA